MPMSHPLLPLDFFVEPLGLLGVSVIGVSVMGTSVIGVSDGVGVIVDSSVVRNG